MVDRKTRRIMHAPTLGWKDVELERPLSKAMGLPVHIENSVRASAMAQAWAACKDTPTSGNLVFVGTPVDRPLPGKRYGPAWSCMLRRSRGHTDDYPWERTYAETPGSVGSIIGANAGQTRNDALEVDVR
ncbi:MAG: ROK family protein [Vicinamibacteria bacterium]|nr:ROK family protein [Vicinamibacteria bacterium]